MRPWRVRLAALLALALVAAACGGEEEPSRDAAGNELTRIDFAFEWTCSGDWALQYIAEKQGYWDQAGVDVRYVRGQGGSGTLPLVASGERDMAEISAPPVVLGAADDLPVTVVGVAAAESPVVLFADGSIKKPEDLYGKTVAVQSGEFEGGVWEAFVKKTGLDVSKIKTVPATGT
jgi:NitT/TauT family transport system substrate-binding protein